MITNAVLEVISVRRKAATEGQVPVGEEGEFCNPAGSDCRIFSNEVAVEVETHKFGLEGVDDPDRLTSGIDLHVRDDTTASGPHSCPVDGEEELSGVCKYFDAVSDAVEYIQPVVLGFSNPRDAAEMASPGGGCSASGRKLSTSCDTLRLDVVSTVMDKTEMRPESLGWGLCVDRQDTSANKPPAYSKF